MRVSGRRRLSHRRETGLLSASGSSRRRSRGRASSRGEAASEGPLAPRDGDEKRAEARRFAELLVSEIKLYNEQAVREGREAGNLYRRLKAEIDLSRQMYEERIPETVRAGSDFLYERARADPGRRPRRSPGNLGLIHRSIASSARLVSSC